MMRVRVLGWLVGCALGLGVSVVGAGPAWGASQPVIVEESSSAVGASGVTLGAVIEPGEAKTACSFEYGPEELVYPVSVACPEELVGSAAQSQSVRVEGLEPNRTYHYRVSASNEVGSTSGPDRTFTTGLVKPAVVTGGASGVARTEAFLSGEVNAENTETFYYFQYGATETYGRVTPVTMTPAHFGMVALPAVRVGELKAGSVYHYRLVASNVVGTTVGLDRTLTTAPALLAVVGQGSVVVGSPVSATIAIQVNPNGLPAGYTLELGVDTSYGTSIFRHLPVGTETVGLEFPLTGLLPGSVYHYRLLVSNQDGTSTGEDHVFSTSGFPQGISQPPTPLLIATPPFPSTQTGSPGPREPKTSKHKKKGRKKGRGKRRGRRGAHSKKR